MDLKFVVLILIGIYSQQLVQAAITWTTPASGDAATTGTAITEANTAVATLDTVDADPNVGQTLDAAAAIVSIDGLTDTANYKFEFDNLALKTKAGATFDYETKTEHVVIFTIGDSTETATGTFTVSIGDVDEHTPSFAGVEKCGAIAESSQEDAEVGVYPAHDMDGSAAKRVTSYDITGGDDAGAAAKFQISNKGVITRTAVALDAATKSSYPLVVEARGPTNTGTATISVTVGGGDDAGAAAKFQIDSDGILTRTAVALDAATKSSYPLVIEARGPTNTGTTTISVTVGGSCPGCGAGNGAGHVKAGVATMFAAFLYLFI